MARAFSTNQKLALLAKARFHCQICGIKISWATCHADHVIPYAKGGKTILINGQALCAPCNLKKGVSTMRKSLPWQQEGLDLYVTSPNKDFVIVAGTGCGKTHLGTICASYTKSVAKEKTLIFVVVPYRAIKSGWKKAFKQQGYEVATMKKQLADDTDVIITTYAGAANILKYYHEELMDTKLILVFDEFHHMEETNTWAKPFVQDMDESEYVKRIFLSGTPWHESGEISGSMVEYVDKKVVADYVYTYGENVRESLVRGRNTVAVRFGSFHAKATNKGFDKVKQEPVTIITDTEKMTESEPMTPLVNFSTASQLGKLDGVIDCLEKGLSRLKETRKIVPTAGGIIFVKDKKAGDAVKNLLRDDYNTPSTLVSSDDPQAHAQIDSFRESKEDLWIIAIDMVSEGVDIPRLKVAVDITNKMTMMHVIQRWGRIFRLMRHADETPAKNTEAYVYYIAHPLLRRIADEIEKDMRRVKKDGVGGDGPGESNFAPGEITETSKPRDDVFKGRTLDQKISGLADWIISTGYMDLVRDGYGLNEALLLAKQMLYSNTVPECYVAPDTPSAEPTKPKKKETKDDVVDEYKTIQGRIANASPFWGNFSRCAKHISQLWSREHGTTSWTRDNKTLEQLQERRDFMTKVERGQY